MSEVCFVRRAQRAKSLRDIPMKLLYCSHRDQIVLDSARWDSKLYRSGQNVARALLSCVVRKQDMSRKFQTRTVKATTLLGPFISSVEQAPKKCATLEGEISYRMSRWWITPDVFALLCALFGHLDSFALSTKILLGFWSPHSNSIILQLSGSALGSWDAF